MQHSFAGEARLLSACIFSLAQLLQVPSLSFFSSSSFSSSYSSSSTLPILPPFLPHIQPSPFTQRIHYSVCLMGEKMSAEMWLRGKWRNRRRKGGRRGQQCEERGCGSNGREKGVLGKETRRRDGDEGYEKKQDLASDDRGPRTGRGRDAREGREGVQRRIDGGKQI